MRTLFAIAPFTLVLLVSLVSIAPAKTVPGKRYHVKESPQVTPPPADFSGGPALSSAAADTFNLGWFSFDSGGVPDPEGWVSVDLTAQPTFWHVASDTPGTGELNGGNSGNLRPLEGNKSMWCGQAASTDPLFCRWATPPGYGNTWAQFLISETLPGDSVRTSYKVFWEGEPGYDGTVYEWSGDGGLTWVPFPVAPGLTARPNIYDLGPTTLVETFTRGGLGSVKLRFRFESDGAWSDEDGLWPTDGAILLDSISVTTWASGVQTSSNFEDFEGAADGDTVVGIWTAAPVTPFGDFGALYPGSSLLQEDLCFRDITNLWGWFDDPAITNYNCHKPDPRPDIGAVPFPVARPDLQPGALYMNNEIWSPLIPNIGAGDEYILEFLTYRDLPFDNNVFYGWSVQSINVTGCPGRWKSNHFSYFGGQKDWHRNSFQAGQHVDPTASQIRIAITVFDGGIFGCGFPRSCSCHSHAPLIDEVHIKRINVVDPRFTVRHIDLFQDNFSEDGTLTCT